VALAGGAPECDGKGQEESGDEGVPDCHVDE
jgi:hypothetical protein